MKDRVGWLGFGLGPVEAFFKILNNYLVSITFVKSLYFIYFKFTTGGFSRNAQLCRDTYYLYYWSLDSTRGIVPASVLDGRL
jgi:hypothetical protein